MAVTGITSLNSFAMNSANAAPHGAAFIPSLSQVWVPDNTADAFFKYSREGSYVSRSNLDAGNGRPRGACFAMHGGNAHVVCVDSNRTTYVYRTDGTLRGTINTTARLSTVEGVAWHNGSLYYVDRGANQIVRIPVNTNFSGIGADPVNYALNSANSDARGIAHVSLAEEFWVLQGTTVHRYSDSDLSYQGTFSLDSAIRTPRALVEVLLADNSGQLWVADNANDTFYRHTLISRTLVPPVQVTGVMVTVLSASSLRVNWTAIAGVTDYEVSVDSGAWMSAGADDTEIVLTGLNPSTTYSVRVRARNADGAGPASVAVTGQTQAPPAPGQVTGVTVTAVSDTSLRVNWTALTDALTDYEVSVDGGAWMSAGADDTEFIVTGLTALTQYAVRVRAVNGGSAGSASASVSGQTQNTPNPVTLRFAFTSAVAGEGIALFIAFRDPVTDFTAADITVTGGTKGALFGASRSYSMQLTPTAGTDGTLEVSVAANVVTGGNSAASVSVQSFVRRTVTIGFNRAFVLNGETATARIIFSGSVTGLAASDFRLTGGGTLGALTGTGTDYEISVIAPATGTGRLILTLPADATIEPSLGASGSIDHAADFPLSIEAIDEQSIPIFTEDYVLEIDITGTPERAYVDGDMEGFYHEWDAANSKIRIKSIEVTRLLTGAIWNVHLVKGTDTLDSQIIYNVVPSAPVIESLAESIVLYKGEQFNLAQLVSNDPSVVRSSGLIVGLKYINTTDNADNTQIKTEGLLPKAANLTESSFMMRQQAENDGGTDTLMTPIVIDPGTPNKIGDVRVNPRGSFALLDFDDVPNALSYEWSRDEDTWNEFFSGRPVIDFSKMVVVGGHLSVKVTFPRVMGATAYQYRLRTENFDGLWTNADFQISNDMVSIIIPDLEEGVEYTIYLRVSSPWIGSVVPVTVVGGRLAAVINYNSADTANHTLYLFNTGVVDGGIATRIKRLLLPAVLTNPTGLVLDGDYVYISNHINMVGGDVALYVFNHSSFNDGDRMTVDRKNILPYSRAVSVFDGLSKSGNEIFFYFSASTTIQPVFVDGRINVAPADIPNGQPLTKVRSFSVPLFRYSRPPGFSIYGNQLWYFRSTFGSMGMTFIDKDTPDGEMAVSTSTEFFITSRDLNGTQVIGDIIYAVYDNPDRLLLYDYSGDSVVTVRSFSPPVGLGRPRHLAVQE